MRSSTRFVPWKSSKLQKMKGLRKVIAAGPFQWSILSYHLRSLYLLRFLFEEDIHHYPSSLYIYSCTSYTLIKILRNLKTEASVPGSQHDGEASSLILSPLFCLSSIHLYQCIQQMREISQGVGYVERKILEYFYGFWRWSCPNYIWLCWCLYVYFSFGLPKLYHAWTVSLFLISDSRDESAHGLCRVWEQDKESSSKTWWYVYFLFNFLTFIILDGTDLNQYHLPWIFIKKYLKWVAFHWFLKRA